jgi:glyoxylase-like metal-dependent hydrolase (beta-lactamase superfamily II)
MVDRLPLEPAAAPVPGRPVALSARVARATAPNPGLMTGPGTNSYLVGTDDLAVVDPGPDDDGHLDELAALGAGRIRWIVVTHTHPDHAPGAAGLAARTGAEVLGFAARDDFVPTRAVGEGFEVHGAGFTLRALHTPGHASNHLCWLLVEEQMLFSGDHVMQGSTVVIAPPDGDMARYLASLRRLLVLAPPLDSIAPGHGSLIAAPAAALQGVIEHRLGREAAVAAALRRAGRATVDELLPTVYADVRDELLPVARQSLWAHLRKLDAEGAVRGEDRADVEAAWVSTT